MSYTVTETEFETQVEKQVTLQLQTSPAYAIPQPPPPRTIVGFLEPGARRPTPKVETDHTGLIVLLGLAFAFGFAVLVFVTNSANRDVKFELLLHYAAAFFVPALWIATACIDRFEAGHSRLLLLLLLALFVAACWWGPFDLSPYAISVANSLVRVAMVVYVVVRLLGDE